VRKTMMVRVAPSRYEGRHRMVRPEGSTKRLMPVDVDIEIPITPYYLRLLHKGELLAVSSNPTPAVVTGEDSNV